MARMEGNKTLSQDQVQQFLTHAAKTHDEKVMSGERGPNLFPKPVYEEPPVEQREKMYLIQREKLIENITDPAAVKNWEDDIPRFNALCRGEELRVKFNEKMKNANSTANYLACFLRGQAEMPFNNKGPALLLSPSNQNRGCSHQSGYPALSRRRGAGGNGKNPRNRRADANAISGKKLILKTGIFVDAF